MEELKSVVAQTNAWALEQNIDVLYQHEVTSTNDLAKQQAGSAPKTLRLYLCDTQTAGRGRGEHTWLNAQAGSSLLSSWSFPIEKAPQHITGPLLGLAVYCAARETWPNLEWSLKAPNDLFLEDKKIAGILAESMTRGSLSRLIVGVGFNVTSHPEPIDTATHLTSELGLGNALSQDKWSEFLSHLHAQLTQAVERSGQEEMSDEDRDHLLKALNANPLKPGVFLEVTPHGDLVLEKRTISWKDL